MSGAGYSAVHRLGFSFGASPFWALQTRPVSLAWAEGSVQSMRYLDGYLGGGAGCGGLAGTRSAARKYCLLHARHGRANVPTEARRGTLSLPTVGELWIRFIFS